MFKVSTSLLTIQVKSNVYARGKYYSSSSFWLGALVTALEHFTLIRDEVRHSLYSWNLESSLRP